MRGTTTSGRVSQLCAALEVLTNPTWQVRQLTIAEKGPGRVRNTLNQVAVVRDDHQRARPIVQQVFQFLQRVNIQVIRRLVEQQEVRLTHQHACELQAATLTAGEVCDWGALPLRGKTQSLRQLRGANLLLAQVNVGRHVLHSVEHTHIQRQIIELLSQPTQTHRLALNPLAIA